MLEKILKLGKHSVIYGIGSALTAIGAFVLLPLYTHVFSTGEYGILELLNRTADILTLIIMMGVRQAFIRFYFEKDTEDWHKKVVSTTVIFLLFSSVLLILLFLPFKNKVADILFKDPHTGVLFLYIAVWIPLDLMVNVGLTHLQIQMKSVKYVIINAFKFFIFIGSNILLVYYFKMGIRGVLITNVWVSGLIGAGFLIYFIKWGHLKLSIPLLKDLLIFGLPYLPTAFFGYIINNGDRYFLSIYSTLAEVGIYALAFKIGMFGSSLIMEAFRKVWSPFLYDNYDKEDGPELISKVFHIYTLILVAVGLGISISAPIIVPLISDNAYHEAYRLVPLICIAAIFYDMAIIADAGILISKKTGYKPFIFGAAAAAGVLANFLLVPKFGGAGAGTALSISFFTLFVVNYTVSNRFYPIKIELSKLILIFGGAVFVYFIANYVHNINHASIQIQIASLATFFLYPIILWFGGLVSNEEKELILQLRTRKAGH